MNCHNCKSPLKGDEDFCPRCGAPQKFTDTDSGKENESSSCESKGSGIFQSEPVYIYTDAPPKEIAHKKPKFTIILVSLFILTVLGIGAVSLGQYLKLTPVFSGLFTTENVTESTTTTSSVDESEGNLGIILPDINLKTVSYTVTAEKGLPLRKGPDNAYALVGNMTYGTLLQLVGKNLNSDLWVYVYVPSQDIYGWVTASYITESNLLPETHTTAKEEKEEEPEKAEKEKLSDMVATIIAENGLCLRQGPGTEYEIIAVVSKDKTVTVLDKNTDSEWLYVKADTETGYMNRAYLSL